MKLECEVLEHFYCYACFIKYVIASCIKVNQELFFFFWYVIKQKATKSILAACNRNLV